MLFSSGVVITASQSALELLMRAKHEAGTHNIIIDKAQITEDFFILRTGLAGEILQKYVNYGGRIAIYGDYSHYTSKVLRDFIYESNKGHDVFLLQPRKRQSTCSPDRASFRRIDGKISPLPKSLLNTQKRRSKYVYHPHAQRPAVNRRQRRELSSGTNRSKQSNGGRSGSQAAFSFQNPAGTHGIFGRMRPFGAAFMGTWTASHLKKSRPDFRQPGFAERSAGRRGSFRTAGRHRPAGADGSKQPGSNRKGGAAAGKNRRRPLK
ncbi:MAG: DUF4180 domain-containing protein [Oscillospiraceae bacterium]|nr:DUF4180 domain-containing protein [Oscillospiraceae bacterium]